MSGDTITVLRCARGLRLAKLIRPGEIVTYDSTRTYDAWTVQVAGLADLETLLADMIEQPRLCVVRGKLAGGDKMFAIRRLLYPDRETGDAATLLDVPRQWVALDIEGVQRPPSVPVADLAACARVAVQRLPAAFNSAACIVQATAGHGIKPDLRLRLWYWLSRPTDGGELKRWLKGHPADASIFRPAQICYTAAPAFEGLADHLPTRLLTIPGHAEVRVPAPAALALPARRAATAVPQQGAAGASSYAWAALRNAIAKVSAAPTDSRHPTCVAQAWRLARLAKAGLLSASDVTKAMADGLEQAGKTREEGEAIAAWALAQPSSGAAAGNGP